MMYPFLTLNDNTEIVESTAHLILEFSQEGGFQGNIDN